MIRKILIINDRNYPLAIDLIDLFYRAGYKIDIVTGSKAIRFLSKKLNLLILEKNKDKAVHISHELYSKNKYEMVVPSTDSILQAIVKSNLLESEKLALLPVIGPNYFSHIYSKIKLSEILSKHKITTPFFKVAISHDDLLEKHNAMDLPYIIKLDSSGAGLGVYEINTDEELRAFVVQNKEYPLLLQEKIIGKEMDISGYFHNNKLVYLYIAESLQDLYKYGPSSVRKYFSKKYYKKEIIDELNAIAKAMGINGFTNISCFEKDKRRYYFEVDLRPNAWINHGRLFGHDLAEYLARDQFRICPNLNENIVLAHYMRVSFWDLVLNKYGVRDTVPLGNGLVLMHKKFRNMLKFIKKVIQRD